MMVWKSLLQTEEMITMNPLPNMLSLSRELDVNLAKKKKAVI